MPRRSRGFSDDVQDPTPAVAGSLELTRSRPTVVMGDDEDEDEDEFDDEDEDDEDSDEEEEETWQVLESPGLP